MPTFPHYRQHDAMDCGPTCLRMVAKHYGKNYSIDRLRTQAEYSREGVSILGIAQAAEAIGFKSTGVQLSYKQLIEDVQLPAILHWGQNHFVVLVKAKNGRLVIADPAKSKIVTVDKREFLERWAHGGQSEEMTSPNPSEGGGFETSPPSPLHMERGAVSAFSSNRFSDENAEGMALLLETTPAFFKQEGDKNKKLGWGLLSRAP